MPIPGLASPLGGLVAKGKLMQYVRDLPSQEIRLFTFHFPEVLEKFVIAVCAEGDFDYEVLTDTTLAVPDNVVAYCRRRASEYNLEFTTGSADTASAAARSLSPPSQASWDAFINELESLKTA